MKQFISLYYCEGTSDKVYQVSIEEKESGFVVNYAYGRRGRTLTPGTKTSTPVDLENAQKIFDSIVKKQKKEGYTDHESGKPFVNPDSTTEDTGIRCQLLNSVEEDEILKLLRDDNYILQVKMDGNRGPVKKSGQVLKLTNRNGLSAGYAHELEQLKSIPVDFIIDAEVIDNVLYAFDILELNNEDLRGLPFHKRLNVLEPFIEQYGASYLKIVESAKDTSSKIALFEKVKKNKGEGVVAKDKNAPYTPSRPASGGTQLKYKFYDTASFVVNAINNKRSVKLSLLDASGTLVPAGNVTIPPSSEIPQPGAIVEVKYLYAYKESGSIYQPVFLGTRNDIDREDCKTTQLKYKAALSTDEE